MSIFILAAGQGTRMRRAMPKVLHPVAGLPLLGHVLELAQGLSADVTVICHRTTKRQLDMADVVRENQQMKTILVDIDNTLTLENRDDSYPHKKPNRKLIAKLRDYKTQGYQIILYTARRMETHKNDEARLIADIGKITLEWLSEHGVPYDGIRFGKPHASAFLIDDKAVRPSEFMRYSYQELSVLVAKEPLGDD